MYRCVNCKKEVVKIEERVRCPYCGYRIVAKLRPEVTRRVRAL